MLSGDDVKRALWRSFIDNANATVDHWQRLFEQPEESQQRLLLRMLSANRDCAFGQAHDFAGIRDSEQFRKRVPIHTYAQLQPWIERAQHEQGPILTASPPLFFERSSGNSAVQKHIPYTQEFLGQLQGSLTVWLADMYRQVPEISHGSGYWSMSPPLQQPAMTANDIPIGSASDLQYLQGSAIAGLAGTLLIPELASDVAHWRRQTLLGLIADAGLSFISVWSPTFLTSVLQPLLDTESPESRQIVAWLEERLPATRQKALRHALAHGVFTELWPRLAAVSCWMDGPSRVYAQQLAARFPQARWLPKGLFATEGVVSLPFGEGAGCPLAIGSHYLEFIGDDGLPKEAHALRMGETAQVLLTTGAGLYRYALGDRVRVVGKLAGTPRVEFVGRCASTCDLVGEKLDEQLVERALAQCMDAADSACLIPDSSSALPHYVVLLCTSTTTLASICRNTLANSIEMALQRSFHYAHARTLGQLGPVRMRFVCGGAQKLAELLQRAAESTGIRAGDVKPRALISRLDTADALLAITEEPECPQP
ncbi:GH3 auxin-responsive promoter family protein [Pseudomonas syringae]|uniref:GH3 family domain-containing protein n=1 Tax=Pseudomonas syringae TaxID=317 RepID=UPI001BCEDF7A|nr:GH3 auxin-responsive promoter family protein [Pseudomonas syringae]MBS7425604.1 GH3 auxin-responsive promoter family protein [Pseudomonas syringae]MBS7431609.1 GH3 auxin-responsive promoter family protein [Pseudomonas syringae]QVI78288.1 GH3 auxin-responsive promoter family protein [Pseudomonas syringae]